MIDDRIRELRPREEWFEDSGEREMLATFLDRGEAMKVELLRFAHVKAGADPGDDPGANVCGVDVGEIKRWLRKANALVAALHRERHAHTEALGQAALDSGMGAEGYTDALIAQSVRNMKAWAEQQGLSEQEAMDAFEKLPPLERKRIIGPPPLD
jgi:hypothetical protein